MLFKRSYSRFGRPRSLTWLAACGALLCGIGRARAGGFEDSVTGTTAVGRGAAVLRGADFLATYLNPANLARVPASDLGGELRLPLFEGCFDRAKDNSVQYRTEDRTMGYGGSESFSKVCNAAGAMPAGNLGFARGLDSGWGFGIGFFTPAATPGLKYGNDLIVTQKPLTDEAFDITLSGEESPNRFMLLKRETLGGFLMVGAAAQPSSFLRFGLSAGLGFLTIHSTSMASVLGGTFVDQEVLVDVHASDWFIPRATASAVVTPLPELELGLVLTTQGSVKASGHVDMTANGFVGVPLQNCRAQGPGMPGAHCRIDDVALSVPFPPFEATLGARYAKRRNPGSRASDPMVDEAWDVELNGYWSQTSHIDEFALKLYDEAPGSPGAPTLAFTTAPSAAASSIPANANIPRHLRDTFGFRLGGDYALIPGALSVRAGVSYETRAVPPQYMNIDLWPVAKFGIHLGGSVRLDNWTLAAGFSHVFFQPVEVAVGKGAVTEIVSQNPTAAQAVNEGRYDGALSVVSVQANAAF